MIKLSNISKDYPEDGTTTRALADISFEIKKGEFVAIMGPSGSGKSTLLHILSFLDRPTGGLYAFNGKEINQLTDAKLAAVRNNDMGFVFQAFNLLSRASVYENVELPLLYSVRSRAERQKMVKDAVASVGLSEKLYTEAGKLSGGQKQRVAIARALINAPAVIFADEPTGNLDSVSGEQVMEILEKLNQAGHTIVLVTHETYTSQFARRLIRLKDGRLEYDGAITKNEEPPRRFFK